MTFVRGNAARQDHRLRIRRASGKARTQGSSSAWSDLDACIVRFTVALPAAVRTLIMRVTSGQGEQQLTTDSSSCSGCTEAASVTSP